MKNSHLVPTTKLPKAFTLPQIEQAMDLIEEKIYEVQTYAEQVVLRDEVDKLRKLSAIYKRVDLEVKFSVMHAKIERVIAKMNPPIPPSESGAMKGKGMNSNSHLLSKESMYQIRKVHNSIDDVTFASICDHALQTQSVVTRKLIKEVGTTVHQSTTKDGEWYTPAGIIESARLVMGSIDLDPATSVEANKVVGATNIYTQADDGLSRSWSGNVWLNPPFTAKECRAFTTKTADSYLAGDISQAIVLVQSVVDTDWAQHLLDVSTCICFHAGRPNFWRPSGSSAGALFGHIIYGLGVDATKFIEQFSQFGVCWSR